MTDPSTQNSSSDEGAQKQTAAGQARLWFERVTLQNFRNYAGASLEVGPDPVVLLGQNGAGKTNFLEALSLFAPGRGLRRAQFGDLASASPTSSGDWTVSARIHSLMGPVTIGTGMRSTRTSAGPTERAQRIVRIDGDHRVSSGVLSEYVDMVWLTPAMDGLFTGPASERRRFLDQLVLCFDSSHRATLGRYERAMQQRNRHLSDGQTDTHFLKGLEQIMAETGVTLAAARRDAVGALAGVIAQRRQRNPSSPFPWSSISVAGALEDDLASSPAVEVEDRFAATLEAMRGRDRAAGRALDGPHRSDLIVSHGPKAMPARVSSTGEQKALLLGLVLAHAELIKAHRQGRAPVLLLDEVAAHLDAHRRGALFGEINQLAAQAWMTGTDPQAFAMLGAETQIRTISDGEILT